METGLSYQAKDEEGHGAGQQSGPLKVKRPHGFSQCLLLLTVQANIARHYEAGNDQARYKERHLHTKLPPPSQVISHDAAQRSAKHRPYTPGDVDVRLKAPADPATCQPVRLFEIEKGKKK
jgi:hypothetical protein